MELEKNTPIYFKKQVLTEHTPPNALYIRFKEQLPKSEAHEIFFHEERWIVGRDQIRTHDEARAEAAAKFVAEIEKAKAANPQKPWEAMEISQPTFKRRMKFVQQHLVVNRDKA